MSPDARFMCGLSLILIPTIVYGGLTILSVITGGQVGTQGPENLSASQIAFGEPRRSPRVACTFHSNRGGLCGAPANTCVASANRGDSCFDSRIGRILCGSLRKALRFVLYTGAALVAAVTLTADVGLIRSR
jgi:hypothetical protein